MTCLISILAAGVLVELRRRVQVMMKQEEDFFNSLPQAAEEIGRCTKQLGLLGASRHTKESSRQRIALATQREPTDGTLRRMSIW